MFIIRKLKIKIVDENQKEWGKILKFSERLNIIIGQNDVGKSTMINSIYYALGMEELLGYRDSKALKPALRDIITNKRTNEFEYEAKILESFIFLEIKNLKGEIITLRRAAKSKSITEKIITVYLGSLEEISSLKGQDYFLGSNSSKNLRGFFNFLEEFLGLTLPSVDSYVSEKVKLYLQNIFSAFFIEQVSGWSDLMANIPTYYSIIHPKQRTIEYILNLDYYKIVMQKNEYEIRKKKLLKDYSELIFKIEIIIKSNYIFLEGFEKEYPKYNKNDVSIYTLKDNMNNILLDKYIEENEVKLDNLHLVDHDFKMGNIVSELRNKIDVIRKEIMKKEKYLKKYEEARITLEAQNRYLEKEKNNVSIEILNFKDIKKLNDLGSKEEIDFDKCPYCNQQLSDTLYLANINIMPIEENIKYLKEKEKIFTSSLDINNEKIKRIELKTLKLKDEISVLYKELDLLNKELPEISIQKSILQEEILIKNKIETLKKVRIELNGFLDELEEIKQKIQEYDNKIQELPKDKFSESDNKTLKRLNNDFLSTLKELQINKNSLTKVQISKETYIPKINDFNIKLHISASDFIRLQWAYYLSLVKNSRFEKNILIFDEPGQQNIDISSIYKLFNILNHTENLQTIVSYAVSHEEEKEVIEFFKTNKINYFYIDKTSIELLENN